MIPRLRWGFTAFNTEQDYPDFNERKIGMAVTTSYPLNGFAVSRFGGTQDRSVNRERRIESRSAPDNVGLHAEHRWPMSLQEIT